MVKGTLYAVTFLFSGESQAREAKERIEKEFGYYSEEVHLLEVN